MKWIKRGFLIMILVIIFAEAAITVQAKSKYDSRKEVLKLQNGWNLGHSFDTGDSEIALNNPIVTKDLIVAIKKTGFKSVRIPITWEGHFDSYHKGYTINQDFFNRLDNVISMCLDQHLYVCINMENDSWRWFCRMKKKKDTYDKMFCSLWKQIAKHYKGYSEKLIFEAMDKPYFEKLNTKNQQKLLNEVERSFVKIVRKTGGKNKKRLLGVATLNSSISTSACKATNNNLKKLKDKRVFATVHYYGPWNFSVNAGGTDRFSTTVQKQVSKKIDLLYHTFYKNKRAVLCTEYGLLGYDSSYNGLLHGEVLKYIDYLNAYARKKKIGLLLWDNGNIFNRKDLKFNDFDLGTIITAQGKVRSASADKSNIYLVQDGDSKDIKLKLQLNGNKFVSVMDLAGTLTKQEFSYKKNQLVIKSKYWKKLNRSNIGQIDTLILNFSKGNSWKIPIVVTKSLALTSAKGTKEQLMIPVTPNVERVTKMSAIYDKKKVVVKKVKKKKVRKKTLRYAGPLSYTPYQEYGYSFYQSLDGNNIVLTSAFIQSLKNEVVHLKFYFESGNKVEYDIVKDKNGIKEVNYKEVIVKPSQTPKGKKIVKKKVAIKNHHKSKKITKNTIVITKTNMAVFLGVGFLILVGFLYCIYHGSQEVKTK